MEKTKNILIKKIKGIFFNHNGNYNKEYFDNIIFLFRKLNYITIGILQQSIHHVTLFSNENKILEKIQINFRPLGIKPEDIDGFLLQQKKEKDGLTPYEQNLYGIWIYHYDKNRTFENKTIAEISKHLYNLKQKWAGAPMTPFNECPIEEQKEIIEESKSLYLSSIKY